MTHRFNTRQFNNLLTGTVLAAELPASTDNKRAFLIVSGDVDDPERSKALGLRALKPPSRFLNADHSDVRFGFRIYEIEKKFIEHPELTDSIMTYEQDVKEQSDIASLTHLEEVLTAYLDDLSVLDVIWRVIPYR